VTESQEKVYSGRVTWTQLEVSVSLLLCFSKAPLGPFILIALEGMLERMPAITYEAFTVYAFLVVLHLPLHGLG
jgi:hypothetical protein